MTFSRFFQCGLAVLAPLIFAVAAYAQEITFSYSHYPPYSYIEQGQPQGEFIRDIDKIATAAGITVSWEYIDMNGVVNILNRGQRVMCEAGRSYSAERFAKWQYSPYLLTTIPGDVVVTRPENLEKIAKHKTIENLVNDQTLHAILAKGQLYSEPVEQALKNKIPWIDNITSSDDHSNFLVWKGRADYSISDLLQLREAQKRRPILNELVYVMLDGQMKESNLYVVCTKATPIGILEKINIAMKDLNYKIGPEFLKTDQP